jgi:hypothetical protein
MAPGLLARGDVPKFQFLGVVLGTAHAPGYPLFVQLSWLFSQLPFGSVAWRVNLMTMLFGVGAAGAAAWAARNAGASRPAALLAAWGLAFGPVFWEQATAVEVYTLAACLHATVLALVLRWGRTRRDRDLLAAVAVSALALGHHPTFAMTAPALAVFVLLTDWRVLTRVRVMAGAALLVVLGLTQYLFVIWRTLQGGLYVEARARNLGELVEVLRGSQYDQHLFAFSGSELVGSRVPFLAGLVVTEMTWAGVALAAVGLALLAWRAPRPAALLALTAVIVFGFAMTYAVNDIHVFVIPVFLALWIAAAVGLTTAATTAAPPHALAALALGCAMALGAWQVARGYAAHDLSRETWDDEYVTAMLDHVDTPATLLFDDYDPMSYAVRYKLYAEKTGHRLRVGYAGESRDPETEYTGERAIYANERSRAILEAWGIETGVVELDARLSDRLRALPGDAIVAVVLPPGASAWLTPDDVRFLQALGARRLPDAQPFAIVARRDGSVLGEPAGPAARVDVEVDAPDGRLTAEYAGGVASVSLGRRQWQSDRAGLVVAIDDDGEAVWIDELDRAAGLRPTFSDGRRTFYRVARSAPCSEPRSGWAIFDAPAAVGTRVSAWLRVPDPRDRSSVASLTIWAFGDDAPVSMSGRSLGDDRRIDFEVETYDRREPAQAASLVDALVRDGAAAPEAALAARFATRVTGRMSGGGTGAAGVSALVALSARARAVLARGVATQPVRFCLPPVQGVTLFADRSEARRELVRAQSDAIGPGWHGPEGRGAERLRWTSAARSVVWFSMAAPFELTLRLEGGPQVVSPGDAIDVVVNGAPLGAQPLVEGQPAYLWRVPAAVVRAGVNEIVLVTPEPRSPLDWGRGQDPRPLGFGVRGLTLERASR